MKGCGVHLYSYVPTARVEVSIVPDLFLLNRPVSKPTFSEVAVCSTESLFVNVILSPLFTVSCAGEKAKPSIVTLCSRAAGEAMGVDVPLGEAVGEEAAGLVVAVGLALGLTVTLGVGVGELPRSSLSPPRNTKTATTAKTTKTPIRITLFIII